MSPYYGIHRQLDLTTISLHHSPALRRHIINPWPIHSNGDLDHFLPPPMA